MFKIILFCQVNNSSNKPKKILFIKCFKKTKQKYDDIVQINIILVK